MYIGKQRLALLIDAPANEIHLGRITKTARCALNFVFLMRSMNELMAGFAEGNQVLWAVAACLSTLNMMHTEDRIVRFPMTPLASMPITKEHILPHIPEAQLWAFLIRFALDLRMAELLKIKLRDFDNGSANGQELVNEPDYVEMAVNRVLHRRSEPSFRLRSVEEPCLSVAGLPLSSCLSELTTCSK